MSSNSGTALQPPPRRLSQPILDHDADRTDVKVSAKPWTRKSSLVYNMQSILQRGKAWITPTGSNQSLSNTGFTTVKDPKALFPAVDPLVDGEDCLHDCASCTVVLPRKWSIDEEDKLFGHVNGWEAHVVVATGKNDWVRDITDEKGSLMEKIGRISNEGKQMEFNGRKIMLSASDMPTGIDHSRDHGDSNSEYPKGSRTRCIVLPSWKIVEGVGTDHVEWMMREVASRGSSNITMIKKESVIDPDAVATEAENADNLEMPKIQAGDVKPLPSLLMAPPAGVDLRSCPHRALILMCSHKTRDWRCGASAPLLRKEFERHLRPLGLYRDIHDERPGGVGIYFINHVGGHKYSANVMIYRREGRSKSEKLSEATTLSDEAVQGIWLARVRPEDCENIVKYTVLQGKLVKPQRQLRGGFDRERGLVSW